MIKHLKLNNWKAFTGEKKFHFKEGITFITGINGSGKTSILEGISTALSGRSLTADNPITLLRNSNIPSQIELIFTFNGKNYIVNRSFSSGRKTAFLREEGEKVQIRGWNKVSQKIFELMKVDELFFSRLVYMPEGEVYNYLNDPPKRAISTRINAISGIENLDTIKDIFHKNKIYFSNLRNDIRKSIQKISEIKGLDDKAIIQLENELKELRKEKISLEKNIEKARKEKQKFDYKKQNFQKLLDIINSLKKTLQERGFTDILERLNIENLEKAIESFKGRTKSTEKNISEINKKIGALQQKISNLNNILEMLITVSKSPEIKKKVPCPVCKRPIDEEMAKNLSTEIEKDLENNRISLNKSNKELDKLNELFQNLKNNLSSLREFQLEIRRIPEEIIEFFPFLDKDRVEMEILSIGKHIKESDNKIQKFSQLFKELSTKIEEKIAKIYTAKSEIKQIGLKYKLESKLINLYKGELISEHIEKALQSTTIKQRDTNLMPIYNNITKLWARFKPKASWKIKFQEDGTMILKGNGKNIHFYQLSGGEKTVLLVLARVILCKSLSDIDFLMIDEPLEHLDIRNRRSLLNFLVESNKKGVIPQLLVTTFEETLIRKFYKEPNIQIIYLDQGR